VNVMRLIHRTYCIHVFICFITHRNNFL